MPAAMDDLQEAIQENEELHERVRKLEREVFTLQEERNKLQVQLTSASARRSSATDEPALSPAEGGPRGLALMKDKMNLLAADNLRNKLREEEDLIAELQGSLEREKALTKRLLQEGTSLQLRLAAAESVSAQAQVEIDLLQGKVLQAEQALEAERVRLCREIRELKDQLEESQLGGMRGPMNGDSSTLRFSAEGDTLAAQLGGLGGLVEADSGSEAGDAAPPSHRGGAPAAGRGARGAQQDTMSVVKTDSVRIKVRQGQEKIEELQGIIEQEQALTKRLQQERSLLQEGLSKAQRESAQARAEADALRSGAGQGRQAAERGRAAPWRGPPEAAAAPQDSPRRPAGLGGPWEPDPGGQLGGSPWDAPRRPAGLVGPWEPDPGGQAGDSPRETPRRAAGLGSPWEPNPGGQAARHAAAEGGGAGGQEAGSCEACGEPASELEAQVQELQQQVAALERELQRAESGRSLDRAMDSFLGSFSCLSGRTRKSSAPPTLQGCGEQAQAPPTPASTRLRGAALVARVAARRARLRDRR